MIFWLAGTVGQMFSGFLQSAAYKNLNGTHGIAGWRWVREVLTMVCGLIRQMAVYHRRNHHPSDSCRWILPLPQPASPGEEDMVAHR